MKYFTIFVFAIALVGVFAAPTPKDDVPYEKKGIIRKIAHSPVLQLTGQALTSCAPGMISINPLKVGLAGIKCVVKGVASVVDGVGISLHQKKLREQAQAAKKQ